MHSFFLNASPVNHSENGVLKLVFMQCFSKIYIVETSYRYFESHFKQHNYAEICSAITGHQL